MLDLAAFAMSAVSLQASTWLLLLVLLLSLSSSSIVPLSLEIHEKKPDSVLFLYIMVRRNIDHGAHKLTDVVYVLGGVLLLVI